MTRRSWILTAAAAVVVLLAAAYALSPVLAFNALKDAAKSGDRDRLERVVDFPAVRESLKAQINAGLRRAVGADPQMRDNPFAAFGALLAPVITDRMVDAVVTPEGIAQAVNQGRVSSRPAAAEPAPAREEPKLQTRLSYSGLNRFRADVRRPDRPDVGLAFVLERRGLFAWKLVRIDLPASAFEPN